MANGFDHIYTLATGDRDQTLLLFLG